LGIALLTTLIATEPNVLATNQQVAKILIIRGDKPQFTQFSKALVEELNDYTFEEFILKKDTDYQAFEDKVLTVKPKLFVLLDNQAVYWAQQYNNHETHKPIPGFATMALNLKEILKEDPFISGIAYEVPGYTVMTSLRRLANEPIKNILTVYRASTFGEFIGDAKQQLKRENINLIAVDIDDISHSSKALIKKLNKIISSRYKGKKIDAFWLISDNKIISKETFKKVWLRKARTLDIPILCGIENFVAPKLNFCTFCAIPNTEGLVLQLADMIYSLIDGGYSPDEFGVDYLLSTTFKLNVMKAESLDFEYNPKSLKGVELLK
jgi:hypothetical protein